MNKNFLLFYTILCSYFTIAQNKTSNITYVGNHFTISITDSDKDNFYLLDVSTKTDEIRSKKNYLSTTTTEAQLNELLQKTIKSLTENYIFSNSETIKKLLISISDYVLFMEDNDLHKDSIYKVFEAEPKDLNDRFKKETNYNSFNEFDINKIKTNNLFKIEKTVDNSTDPIIVTYTINDTLITTEVELLNKINEIANSKENNAIIYKYFYKVAEIKELFNLEWNAEFYQKISDLYNNAFKKDNFVFIGNYSSNIIDENNNEIIYNIEISQDVTQQFFTLRFCENNDLSNCKTSKKIAFNEDQTKFDNLIKNALNDKDITSNEKFKLRFKCNELNTEIYKTVIEAPIKKEVDSLVNLIENIETRYSGILKLNKSVSITDSEKKPTGDRFMPTSSSIRFFNNRAKSIVVIGNVIDTNYNIKFEQVSINHDFSVPIRSFNSNMNKIKIRDIGFINYNDVFNYYPYKENYNYAVKNKQYEIKANDTIKIEERKLANYFTPIIFSDFLGLNPGSENGLLLAEGKVRIPLWLFNFRKTSLIPTLNAYVNVSLYNGFDDTTRAIKITKESAIPDTGLVINNIFDYVKFANVMAGISLDIISFELKGLNTDWSFGAGGNYYRTALKHTQTNTNNEDLTTNDQLNAVALDLSMNFQIRPQANFGADLSFKYNRLFARGTKEGTLIDISEGGTKANMINISLDLFSKINPDKSNGGIYGRLGGFYHPESNDFYPQIMVGYATNLSSFINKFQKK